MNSDSHGRLVVVCKDAAIGIFTLPQAKFSISALLPLNDETIRLSFLLLYQYGVQFKFDSINLFLLPSPQGEDAVIERTATVKENLFLWPYGVSKPIRFTIIMELQE
jgi:hypothetical protein